jgi:hypothetical protein
MAKAKTNFGLMTEEETAELAGEALAELPLAARVQAVLKAFDSDEREELAAWLDDDRTAEKSPTD